MKFRKIVSVLLATNIAISTVSIIGYAMEEPVDESLKVTQLVKDVESGEENGKYTIYGPEISEALLQQTKDWDGESVNDHLGSIYDFVDSDRGNDLPEDNQLWYDDTGLYSNILLSYYDEDGDFHRSPYVTQFRLVDRNGNYYYAYCADMNTGAHDDSQYELTNVKDAYYLDDNAKLHIQAITEKGFWGTESGNGSLSSIKNMVSDDSAQYIDAGIALACTQAAIWYYANRSEDIDIAGRISTADGYTKTDAFLQWWSTKGEWDYYDMTDEEKAASLELYNTYINLTPSEPTTTDVIEASDIKNLDIKVNSRDDTIYNVTADTEVYDVDISIEIDADTDYINGDVVISIYQGIDNDNESILVYQSNIDDITSVNNVYTIKNLKLEENLDIIITITGTQKLDSGAYLFTSMGVNSTDGDESQSFIGLITKNSSRDVDIYTGIKFNVDNDTPIPEPTPDNTESPEPEATPTPTPTPAPEGTPTPTPSNTPKPTVTPEPDETLEPEATPTPTPTPTPTHDDKDDDEPTPKPTPKPSSTPTPEATPTPVITIPVPEETSNPKPTVTPVPEETPEVTVTPTPIPENTPAPEVLIPEDISTPEVTTTPEVDTVPKTGNTNTLIFPIVNISISFIGLMCIWMKKKRDDTMF